MSHFIYRTLVFVVVYLHLSVFIQAAAQELNSNTILFPPPNHEQLKSYESAFSELSKRDQWRIKGFGLRIAALHPLVWGYLSREYTNHRHLVPIKRYFLRASEAQHFEIKILRANFHFRRADKRYMEKMPHQKDPVFEIGFGGVYKKGSDIDKPVLDNSYILRLSAFQRLPSGIFERRDERYKEILLAKTPHLEVGTPYEIELSFTEHEVKVNLNGVEFVRYAAAGIGRGLLSLQTSWHPINLKSLSGEGLIRANGDQKVLQFSGLVPEGKRS